MHLKVFFEQKRNESGENRNSTFGCRKKNYAQVSDLRNQHPFGKGAEHGISMKWQHKADLAPRTKKLPNDEHER